MHIRPALRAGTILKQKQLGAWIMPVKYYGSVKVFYPELSREELVARLRGAMPALQEALPVTRVVLFGSWAKGRATAFSDVDLMVLYKDPPRDDAFRLVKMAVPGARPGASRLFGKPSRSSCHDPRLDDEGRRRVALTGD